jgi:hypothetical protein
MEGDLRDQISQVLSPDVARQLASTVGLDDRQGKTFVDAAVPALLLALASLDGPGAKALSDAVSNADPNMLERLRRALDARDLTPLNDGANALGLVIGAAKRDGIANALANYLDAPVEATTPALGAVEQAVVAMLGQQDPSVWSDGEALRGFLTSQKATFAAAVPAAFATAIAPLPPAPPPPRPAPVSAPVPPPPRPVPPPPAPAPASSGGWVRLLVHVIVIVIAAGGYYYRTQMRPKTNASFLPPATHFTLSAPSSDIAG